MLITSESIPGSSETWSSVLRGFADEQENGAPHMLDEGISTHSCETHTPLQKLSGGAWQSLGGYFDYSDWAARERFMELDKAIAAAPYYQRSELGSGRETVSTSKWLGTVTPEGRIASEIINVMHRAETVFEE